MVSIAANAGVEAADRPMTIDDLLAVKAVGDPQVSPDGRSIVYVVSELDRETNKTNSSLWLVSTDGGEPQAADDRSGCEQPPALEPRRQERSRSSPAGAARRRSGSCRSTAARPARSPSCRSTSSGPIWSPKGDKIAFAAEVYPGKSPEETADDGQGEGSRDKSKVRTYDHLMIRHWNAWNEGKRSHLFVADVATGEAVDLTPNLEVNTPPAPFGGSGDYAWSPDGASAGLRRRAAQGPRLVHEHRHLDSSPSTGGDAEEPDRREPRGRRPAGRSRPTASVSPTYQPVEAGLRVGPLGAPRPRSRRRARRSTSARISTARSTVRLEDGRHASPPRSTTRGPCRSSSRPDPKKAGGPCAAGDRRREYARSRSGPDGKSLAFTPPRGRPSGRGPVLEAGRRQAEGPDPPQRPPARAARPRRRRVVHLRRRRRRRGPGLADQAAGLRSRRRSTRCCS